MKSTTDNPMDPLGALGAPIKPAAKPAAAPVPVAPGIVRQADGTLATNAPEPAPVWVAPTVPVVWIPTPRDEDESND